MLNKCFSHTRVIPFLDYSIKENQNPFVRDRGIRSHNGLTAVLLKCLSYFGIGLGVITVKNSKNSIRYLNKASCIKWVNQKVRENKQLKKGTSEGEITEIIKKICADYLTKKLDRTISAPSDQVSIFEEKLNDTLQLPAGKMQKKSNKLTSPEVMPPELIHKVLEFVNIKDQFSCMLLNRHWKNGVLSDKLMKFIHILEKGLKGEEISNENLSNIPEKTLETRLLLARLYVEMDPTFIFLKSVLQEEKEQDVFKNDKFKYFFTENLTLLYLVAKKDSSITNLISLQELREKVIFSLQSYRSTKVNVFLKKQGLEKDKEFFMLERNGCLLEYASEELRDDKEVVLTAIHDCPYSFKYASKRLLGDREIVSVAIEKNNAVDVFRYVSEELQNDIGLALKIVSKYGWALQWMPLSLRSDRDVVLAAVRHWGDAFVFASEDLRNDWEVALTAVRQNRGVLGWVPIRLTNDESFMSAVKDC